MEKVTFIQIESIEGNTDHAVIDRGNGEFTSMPKSVYDEQQKALKESLVIDEPAAKSK